MKIGPWRIIVVTTSTYMLSLLFFCFCMTIACLSYLTVVFGIPTKCQLTNKWPYEDSVLLGYDTSSLGIRFSMFRNDGNRLPGDAATESSARSPQKPENLWPCRPPGFAIHGAGSEASLLARVAVPFFGASRSHIVQSHIRLIIFVTFANIKFNENPFGGSQTVTCVTEYKQETGRFNPLNPKMNLNDM